MTRAASFMDEVQIAVHGGLGGHGAVHFARFKYKPKGGPDGGDGGRGGDVVLMGDESAEGLEHLAKQDCWKAGSGGNGEGGKRHGADAEPLALNVPLGTAAYDRASRFRLAEITGRGQRFTVASGGRGGRGNARFATAKNKAPQTAEEGQAGDRRELALQYRCFAPIAVVGCPESDLTLLQGLMGKRSNSPHRFHQRPRCVQGEFAFRRVRFTYLPMAFRRDIRFSFTEHLYYAERVLINAMGQEESELFDSIYPRFIKALMQAQAPNLTEIWLVAREDPGLPYHLELGDAEISVRAVVAPQSCKDFTGFWEWAGANLNEFFLGRRKQEEGD